MNWRCFDAWIGRHNFIDDCLELFGVAHRKVIDVAWIGTQNHANCASLGVDHQSIDVGAAVFQVDFESLLCGVPVGGVRVLQSRLRSLERSAACARGKPRATRKECQRASTLETITHKCAR